MPGVSTGILLHVCKASCHAAMCLFMQQQAAVQHKAKKCRKAKSKRKANVPAIKQSKIHAKARQGSHAKKHMLQNPNQCHVIHLHNGTHTVMSTMKGSPPMPKSCPHNTCLMGILCLHTYKGKIHFQKESKCCLHLGPVYHGRHIQQYREYNAQRRSQRVGRKGGMRGREKGGKGGWWWGGEVVGRGKAWQKKRGREGKELGGRPAHGMLLPTGMEGRAALLAGVQAWWEGEGRGTPGANNVVVLLQSKVHMSVFAGACKNKVCGVSQKVAGGEEERKPVLFANYVPS